MLKACNIAYVHESSFNLPSPHVAIAPSITLRFLFGITKFGSISIKVPKPSHLSHFPYGALNENILGSNSCMLIPQSAHAKFSLNNISLSPITFIITNPSANLNAASNESLNLPSMPSFIISLSITASILCFLVFSSFISSSANSYISPSTLALTYPFFFILSKTFSCVPFFPLIIGAKI